MHFVTKDYTNGWFLFRGVGNALTYQRWPGSGQGARRTTLVGAIAPHRSNCHAAHRGPSPRRRAQGIRETAGLSPNKSLAEVGLGVKHSVRANRGPPHNSIQARWAPAHRAGMPGRSGAWRWPHTLLRP